MNLSESEKMLLEQGGYQLSESEYDDSFSAVEIQVNQNREQETPEIIKKYKDKINALYLKNNQLKARIQAMEIEKMIQQNKWVEN